MDNKSDIDRAAQSVCNSNTNPYRLFMLVWMQSIMGEPFTSRLVELVLSSASSFAFMEVFAVKASRVFWRTIAGRRGRMVS